MYKIDRENLRKEKNFYRVFFYIGLTFCIILTLSMIGELFDIIYMVTKIGSIVSFEEGGIIFASLIPLIFVWLFTGVFMKIGLSGMKKVDEKNRRYDYLEQHGKLVKGLTYQMMPTGMSVNDRPIYKIVAKYETDNGSIVELEGDGRFDRKSRDEDGFVDVLIDPMDTSNYYLDFNIEEADYQNYNYSNTNYNSYDNYNNNSNDYDPIQQ